MVLGLQELELVLDAVAGVGGRELQLLRQVRGALEQQETALGAGAGSLPEPPEQQPRARPGPAAPGRAGKPRLAPGGLSPSKSRPGTPRTGALRPGTRPRSPVGPRAPGPFSGRCLRPRRPPAAAGAAGRGDPRLLAARRREALGHLGPAGAATGRPSGPLAGPGRAGPAPRPPPPPGARPRPATPPPRSRSRRAPAPGRAVPSAGFVETSCQAAARPPHGAARCRRPFPLPPRLSAPPPPPLSAPGPAAPAPRPPRPGRAARPAPLPPPRCRRLLSNGGCGSGSVLRLLGTTCRRRLPGPGGPTAAPAPAGPRPRRAAPAAAGTGPGRAGLRACGRAAGAELGPRPGQARRAEAPRGCPAPPPRCRARRGWGRGRTGPSPSSVSSPSPGRCGPVVAARRPVPSRCCGPSGVAPLSLGPSSPPVPRRDPRLNTSRSRGAERCPAGPGVPPAEPP